jgi:NADPH:quinone reductase-like Zn-dependent oxidoreductase
MNMRALIAEHVGVPPRLKTLSKPVPGRGQVLVAIEASAINPLDLKIMAGAAAHARQPLPAVLGLDLAGTVVAVGAEVARFQPGDKVFGMAGGVGGMQGSMAQYAAVDASLLASRPRAFDARQAASLPLAFITAWEGLVDRAAVSAGQLVLVHGGAGGVGHIAVQIALTRGAQVFATGSADSRHYIEGLGATFIDYRSEAPEQYRDRLTAGRGFDVIYDTVGGQTLDASFVAVRRFGHVVSSLGWGTHSLAPLSFRAATYSGVFALLPLLTGEGREHHGRILKWASDLASTGRITPRIDPREFTLESAAEAYDAVRHSRSRGKVVVTVN